LNGFFYFCIIFAFLVRMPIFLVHLWLPRAHVEASCGWLYDFGRCVTKAGGLRVYAIMSNFVRLGLI
jgi:NADH-ubiquinone oxidoreductase chain 4